MSDKFTLVAAKDVRIKTLLHTWTSPAQPTITTSESYFEGAGVVLMRDSFKAQFIDLEVLASQARGLSVDKLVENSPDALILLQLGDKAEIPVSQFNDFLSKHRESTERFVFYLRGKDGNLRSVSASWSARRLGWVVYATPVELDSPWDAGIRIVSCK